MAAWMIPFGMQVASTALSMKGQKRAGKSKKKAARFEAAQMEQQAGQAKAVSQRQAQEYGRQGRLQMSRALAIAAASGGGTGGNVTDIMGDIAGDTNYRKMVALYEGETEAQQLITGAAVRRESGEQAGRAGKMGALGTALAGGTSLYSQYGESEIKPWLTSVGNRAGDAWQYAKGHAFPGGPRKLK